MQDVEQIHVGHPFQDFRNFLWYVWSELALPAPTPFQYDIADFLQSGPRRRVIMAYRGVGKSWITAAYVCWLLWHNPQHKIMVVSASKERADAFSLFVKRLIDTLPELSHLRPRADQRTSNLAFDVGPALPDQSPSVKSVGITGQLTGSRADTIIADDVESPRNSMTVVQREKLGELIKEFDAILKPGGEVVYLGTPQTEESIYNKLPERGYTIRIWTARYPKDTKHRLTYGERLAPIIAEAFDKNPVKLAWKNCESIRFSDDDLLEREASYGRSGFMLQFMLDTTLSDSERYPLKLSDLIVMDIDREVAPVRVVYSSGPEYILGDLQSVGFTGDRFYRPMYTAAEQEEYTGKIMAIDPSGRGGDETGYAVVNNLRGMLYLRRAGATKGGYDDDTLETLAHIARAEKVNKIIVEDNFGDGMFVKLFEAVLKRIYPCMIEGFRSSGMAKELRIIRDLEPVLNQHRLVVDASIIRADIKSEQQYQLFYQLTRLTRDRNSLRHDDRLEAVSMAVGYWADQMARDVTAEEDRYREELRDKEYAEFIRSALGSSPISPNYLDNL